MKLVEATNPTTWKTLKTEVIDFQSDFYWLNDHLEDGGFEVKLSHSLKTKAIAYAKVKTDKVDSVTLARLLRSNLLLHDL